METAPKWEQYRARLEDYRAKWPLQPKSLVVRDDIDMRDLATLAIYLLVTIARLLGPGGARSVVAESLLLKHQLLILNRTRTRAPALQPTDRVVVGLCATLMRPTRLVRSVIVLKPSTVLLFSQSSGET